MLPADRQQSRLEETANSLSHGIGCVLALVLLPTSVQTVIARDGVSPHTIALEVFVAATLLLYLCSALCHGLPAGTGKRFFERLDNAAIYLFIAASCSPFATAAPDGAWHWTMLALVWALALLGVAVVVRRLVTHPLWSTSLYVGLGWFALLAAMPWIERASASGVALLVAGCLVYTFGAGLFLLSARVRFAHLAWHISVMTGGGLHVAAMLLPA